MFKYIKLLEEIIIQTTKIEFGSGDLSLLLEKTKLVITKSFGKDSHYHDKLNSISFPFPFSTMWMITGTPPMNMVTIFNFSKNQFLNLLHVIKEDINLSEDEDNQKICDSQTRGNVFIVHGHNEEMKQTTARTLEKLGMNVIILHEQPNMGRTNN